MKIKKKCFLSLNNILSEIILFLSYNIEVKIKENKYKD